METVANLQTLEQYCETLFNPPDQASRIQAENFLNYHCPTFSSNLGGAEGATSTGTLDRNSGLPNTHNLNIKSPIESALVCRNLLENARNPYALMFATSRLKTLVDGHFSTFTTAEQHGLRSFVLQYIYQHPDLPPFIHAAQAQLFAVITKLGWNENEDFRPLLDHLQVFFQHGVGHRILGFQLLTAVVTEMNVPGMRNFVKHRRAAVGYRDSQLLSVFQTSLAMLRTVLQSQISNPETEKLKEAILLLMRACLAYDFIGTSQEESSEDMGSIQVPASWKVVFEQPGYLDVLWECWKSFSSPVSVLVMECLSQAVSIRRSIFSTEEARNTYIYHIMRETVLTLQTTAGQNKLQDVGNYHEFCRMLSRFKNTFQLTEICTYSDSEQWLSAIGEFTVQGFHSWKTVSSLITVVQDTELFIEAITVNLTREYLKSVLDGVRAVMDGETDDPLESEDTLLLSLEMVANIARTKYTESGRVIVHKFQELLLKYRELIQRASALSGTTTPPIGASDVKESLMVTEMQLTWMVYIMAACIGGRVMYQSKSEQDQVDGEFACEVLGFIHELQVWIVRRPLYLASADAHLYVQSAIIYFYTQFRTSYISDNNSPKVAKVYTQLSSRWGLNTPDQVLDIILNFSLNNLRSSGDSTWRKQESQLIYRTLKLLSNLSTGYNSVKHIRKLDTTKALLKNHTSSDFRFLDRTWMTTDSGVGRCRTMYYATLARILFAEDNVDADFWRFVKSWETTLDQVTRAFQFQGRSELSEEDIRVSLQPVHKPIISLILLGVFKDLRGFVAGISNRKQYNLFFEWFYPTYTPIVFRAIDIWHRDKLSITILRFWHEFCTNKSSRITFDSSSPDGILLFRETSNILYTYGQSLLNRTISNNGTAWSEKYKGIMLYFEIMSVSLSGKYANFGVFKLYGDKALERVLEIFFQLVLVVPVEDMVLFPKLARAFFNVIDVFASEHMTGLPMMPHPVLVYIFQALGQVIPLPSPDATCSSMACSTIDKICTFVFNWLIKNRLRKDGDGDVDEMHDTTLDPEDLSSASGGSNRFNSGSGVDLINNNTTLDTNGGLQRQQGTHWLVDYVMSNKGVLRFLFMVLFKAVTYENRSNHWSLSRPLLGLILLNREFYSEYVMRFVQAQLPDRQEQVQKAVDGLMEEVGNNLTAGNRDRFTANATAYRRECSQMTLMAFNPEDTTAMFS
ncbi:hypothetical protein BGX34_007211 [Mortierella sp. NVP85]|nr:hypothetical protein BGX34_007211 [Mortierella sp. NVP85]